MSDNDKFVESAKTVFTQYSRGIITFPEYANKMIDLTVDLLGI